MTDEKYFPWSCIAQQQRRDETTNLIREQFRLLVDEHARAEKLLWWEQGRVALWLADLYLGGNEKDIAFGHTILRYWREEIPYDDSPYAFDASALANLLTFHGDLLEPEMREYATDLFTRLLHFATTRDFMFHGFNDNMPVMLSWALTAGGELLDNARFTEVAWANLCQLKDLLRRRGTVSEYGLGYATHRLTGIAHIVNHSRDAAFRNLARDIEARLWAELAGHWHPELAIAGGGSMRGQYPLFRETPMLFRYVFGDTLLPEATPWTDYFTSWPAEMMVEFGLDPQKYFWAYPFAYAAEFTSAQYSVPDEIAALFYEKPPGFNFECTSENGYHNKGIFCEQHPVLGVGGVLVGWHLSNEEVCIPHHHEHGAQAHGLMTYHGQHYVLGTSTTNQSETSHAFRCTYRRAEKIATLADYGEVTVRYNINAKVPGGRRKNIYYKSPEHQNEIENYNLQPLDMSRQHCLQYKNSALCLQVPNWSEYWDVRCMRTDIFLFQKYGKHSQHIFVGEREIDKFPFETTGEELITIDEGVTFLAIHPFIGRVLEQRIALKIWEQDEFLIISLFNHDGASKVLSQHEMVKLGNGFAFEVRDADEYSSFAAFQNEMRRARILDVLYGGVRRVVYAQPDLRLTMQVCPYTNTVKERSVNGLTQEIKQFAYNNKTPVELPFLDGKPAVGFEDWDWLETQLTREVESYNPRE